MKFRSILLLVWLSLTSCAPFVSEAATATVQPATKTLIFTPTAYSIPSIIFTFTPPPIKILEPAASRALIPTQTITPTLIFGLAPGSIKSYLVTKVGVTGFGGKVSCAYQILGTSGEGTDTPNLFIWVLCQEYLNGKTLSKGTGMSLPVALYLQKAENSYTISSHKIPGGGTHYGPDIRATFPENTWDLIFGRNAEVYNLRVQMLEYEAEGDAMDYFGLSTPASVRPTFTPIR